MPPEVINLLSSSPPAVSPPSLAPPTADSSRSAQAAPSRVLDYGLSHSTTKTSTKATSRPPDRISGAKRTSSGHTRQDDDFLFLSDDFDTTGDLNGKVSKKPRVSSSTNHVNGRGDSSFKRTKSAVVTSKNRESLSPAPLKRWNTIADPIEHSSSPNASGARKPSNNPRQNPLDPLESPPKKQGISTKSSRLFLSSDPFGSSPDRDVASHRPSANPKVQQPVSNDPVESPKNKKTSKTSKAPVIIDLSDSEPETASGNNLSKKSKQKAAAWDPISSSMAEQKTGNDDLGDSESDFDLPDLGDLDFSKARSNKFTYSLSPSPSPPRKKSKAISRTSSSTAKKTRTEPKTEEEKEQERRKKTEAREAEKERKRVEKEQAKEQRAIDKQKEKALVEVNKLKTDRKVAVPEMIVDLPTTLSVGIKAQIEKLLRDLDVQFEYCDNYVNNVVKWRRKVTSEYNQELEHWEPAPMRIKKEEHVLVILKASEFVKLVLGAEGQDLEAHVLKMKTNFSDSTFVYLIEGLMPWMRKNKNLQNRRFASAVRALDVNNDAGAPSSSQPRRRNNNNAQQEYIDEDVIEDGLLSLQVVHGALIHHTNAAVETAEWVAVFTQHVSTIPYRRAREAAADAGFCMDAGQVRTGEDAKDTYVRMLQEVNRVTAPIAYGIAARYGSVGDLVRGLDAHGPLALENCRKCANRDGAFTDRVVGQAISKRMYKIFTSRDPGSMDV
ncbi:ERCC4 domain-containing protein [Hypoxylon fuscum]|nr:ERCC4 domain-containing protein [Hypoxylon fuscum]